ncbi:hypothetical protein AB0G35_08050 [Streptomyces sp. NPDC021749]|uniref:hypothetical protein n=1 Tax=Streptomyces sp. NPDC021749 TaxID=3154905 RepID=UPI0033C5661F
MIGDAGPALIPKGPGAQRCSTAEAVARRRLADRDARIGRLSRPRARLAAHLGAPADGPGAAPSSQARAAATA